MSETAPFIERVEKDYASSAEQVFDAWMNPAMVAYWFTPQLGEMVRIDRPRRLVFTWCAMLNGIRRACCSSAGGKATALC